MLAPAPFPPEFIAAVHRLLQDEGGYVNNPDDPGNETNFGISKRSYPDLDIANLTRDDAIAIYFRDFWQKFELHRLPAGIASKLLNLAVNMGPRQAIKCLQRALRACGNPAAEDGVLGQLTVDAAATSEMLRGTSHVTPLLAAMRSEAAAYYRSLAAKDARAEQFLKGWLARAYA